MQYCSPLPTVHKVLTAVSFLPYLYKYLAFLEGEKGMLVLSDKCDTRTGIRRFPLEARVLFLVYIYSLVKCLYAMFYLEIIF